MITALVQFVLPAPIGLDDVARVSEANAPSYKGRPGLVRKYFVRSEDGSTVGGVYLWESRADADRCYDDEWRARVTEAYGSEPTITWFDTPVVVDNRHDEIITP
jgi:hypothetical protein